MGEEVDLSASGPLSCGHFILQTGCPYLFHIDFTSQVCCNSVIQRKFLTYDSQLAS